MLNGKPFKILSGAVHYFRIPEAYWEDTLYNLQAMGFNTVETYIPWNLHEPEEGIFDFSGNQDIEAFVRLAQKMGLWVILRPTPFICAEWEFGGLPAWLLRYPDMKVRTNTPLFLSKVKTYLEELFSRIRGLQITQGGPVLMMQVENEYGSFGNEKSYLRAMVRIMKDCGAEVPLFTADGAWDAALEAGGLAEDGILATGNFGSHSTENLDAMEKYFRRHGKKFPLMCMEFWDGWFNRWGEEIITRDAEDLAGEVRTLLKRSGINLYMFQGGTNFGFYNGCSARGETDLPQITSYDYDAVLREWGEPTEKFYKIQEVIRELFPEQKTFPPRDRRRVSYGEASLTGAAALKDCLDVLAEQKNSDYPLTMEEAGSGYGYMFYRTKVEGYGQEMKIRVIQAGDRVKVYLNSKLIATQYGAEIGGDILAQFQEGENLLEILTENLGRVNYGYRLLSPTQKKGIRSGVMVDLHFESGWEQYALDLKDISRISFGKPEILDGEAVLPRFLHYELRADKGEDTFLDMRSFVKGCVFVNGRNLGRYWNKGPAGYLYLPGVYLREGANDIVVFETEGVFSEKLPTSDRPVYF
ncbi:MAG: beta-galactosidase [Clostridiales bacterium]|nr:beta-galactosidase [Clostridiales bacterium]